MIAKNKDDDLGSNISRFRCWNVRTMNGRKQELVAQTEKYRLEVLGVSEAKMRGNGVKMIGDTTSVLETVVRNVDIREKLQQEGGFRYGEKQTGEVEG